MTKDARMQQTPAERQARHRQGVKAELREIRAELQNLRADVRQVLGNVSITEAEGLETCQN